MGTPPSPPPPLQLVSGQFLVKHLLLSSPQHFPKGGGKWDHRLRICETARLREPSVLPVLLCFIHMLARVSLYTGKMLAVPFTVVQCTYSLSSIHVATLPTFGPIEGHKWFDQISSQGEFQKNRFALIYFGKIQFLPKRMDRIEGT